MPGSPPPEFTTIEVELVGDVGHLVLAQPDRLNPMGARVLRELTAASAWLDATGVGAVVVSGAGRAFSAGFDLREFGDAADPDTPALGAAMADSIAGMRPVTVAAVHGACVGGGFVLAMACDLRVATADAWFSLPEAELGIPLAWTGVPRLVRELGPSRALDLVLTCRRVPADEAAAIGLVHRLVDGDDPLPAARELASLIASRPTSVVHTTKAQVAAAAEELVPTAGEWAGTELLVDALRAALGR